MGDDDPGDPPTATGGEETENVEDTGLLPPPPAFDNDEDEELYMRTELGNIEEEDEEEMDQSFFMRTRLSDIEEGDEEGEDLDFMILPEVAEIEEFDEEEGEAAYFAKYNEDYGEDDILDNVPPRDDRIITVEKLEAMTKMLDPYGEEDEGEDNEDEDADFACHVPNPDDHDTTSEIDGESELTPFTESNQKMLVLGPEHPKMKRFQAALRRHLLKQIEIQQGRKKDLESELKEKRKEREDLGQTLHNLQFELSKQTETIEKHESDIEKLGIERCKLEAEAEEVRLINEKLRLDIDNEQKEELKLMNYSKEVDLMEWCVQEALKDYDNQLKISQTVDEKFEKLKKQTEIDKKNQDIYLERLMIRVQQMEQSNDAVQRQIEAHKEEQKELNAFITEATTEIEALQIEKKHLQLAWNETLSVVRSRDEALAAARQTIAKTEDDIKTKENEISSLMKAITKDQEEHEKITVRLKRKKMEERQIRSRVNGIEGQIRKLQTNLAMLSQLKTKMEEEFYKHQNELKAMEKILQIPRNRINKLLTEKKELEDSIMEILQEQAAMDKLSQAFLKQIQTAREKSQNAEDELAKVENELTRITYECEVMRTDLLKKQTMQNELEKKLVAEEKVIKSQTMQMKYAAKILAKKNNEVHILASKLKKLTSESENRNVPALEPEIESLEREVIQNRQACVDLQEKWLKMQDELVATTMKRDEILNANDIRRKEEFVLTRKRVRIMAENEEMEENIKKLKNGIKQAQKEIDFLNSKLYAGKEEQEGMESENVFLHAELVNTLKDAELEEIELENEIRKLEEERNRLNTELGKINEQSIQWEKKVKLAKELKANITKEEKTSSSQIRTAIHHMQVRHNNLRRAQEKLMTDLERCIENRDRIIEKAEIDSRKLKTDPNKILINIKREKGHLRHKQRKLIKEAHEAEEEVKDIQFEITQLEEKVKSENETLKSVRKIIEAAEEKLGEVAIEKHKNLIEIILRQIKYKTLESISERKFKPLLDLKIAEDEIKKMEEKCYAIIQLCDKLLEEFPNHQLPIKLVKVSIMPSV